MINTSYNGPCKWILHSLNSLFWKILYFIIIIWVIKYTTRNECEWWIYLNVFQFPVQIIIYWLDNIEIMITTKQQSLCIINIILVPWKRVELLYYTSIFCRQDCETRDHQSHNRTLYLFENLWTMVWHKELHTVDLISSYSTYT